MNTTSRSLKTCDASVRKKPDSLGGQRVKRVHFQDHMCNPMGHHSRGKFDKVYMT